MELKLSSLVREICQNSLDAALNEDNPMVCVEFERYFVKEDDIPGICEYRRILKQCSKFGINLLVKKQNNF